MEKEENKFVSEVENVKNLQKCPRKHCSIPICPLDLNLPFRNRLSNEGVCSWMQEDGKPRMIAGKEIVFGGRVMPDHILIYVPEDNVRWLNQVSQKRWNELKEKSQLK